MPRHSNKIMWVCLALVALALVVVVSGTYGGYAAPLLLACMLMMGTMMWMMMGSGGR